MFMSRLTLRRDTGAKGALLDLLRDGLDAARAHRVLWTLFGDDASRRRDFLFRRGRGPRSPDGDFLVVSERAPHDGQDLWSVEIKPYEPEFTTGQHLVFKLRANPTVTRGKMRHDVVMDAKRRLGSDREMANAELWESEGKKWLEARAARLGVTLGVCRADGYTVERFRRGAGKGEISIAMLDISGTLEVRDPDLLRAALFHGVGHAKIWGCGLLLVKPR